jgi:hypothetical protein
VAIKGSCFCGAVTYQIDGILRDARSCHCSKCRKAFSSQASAYALMNADEFRWLSGADLLSTYQSEADAGLQFCSQCGSTLCGLYQGVIHGVTLGCVTGDPQVVLERHIFVGSKAPWENIPDGVPQFDEWPPERA